MAKILVADDNSNVQKTVALALADLGVDVISVNNGEAAVKRLSEISPDLVLADIFMPVRNGYEVCEYVKKNSRFAHVPVVLLVGAFDPLDEREAQRVGADGILKKPFVPPDPLITIVKTLLDRSQGERLVSVSVSKPAVSMQGKGGGTSPIEESLAAPKAADEPIMEDMQPPMGRVTFGEGERPIAFGQLLETPIQHSGAPGAHEIEPVDDEQVLTSSRDASLGDPIFWRTEEPEPETEEEDSEADDEVSGGLPMGTWNPGEGALPGRSENEILQPVETVEPVEPFELVRDEPDEFAGKTPTIVEPSASIAQDPAAQAPLTVEAGKAEDLAANPIEWMATAPPLPVEEEVEAASEWGVADTRDIESEDEIGSDKMASIRDVFAHIASSQIMPPVPTAVPVPPPAPAQPQAKIASLPPDPVKTHPGMKPFDQKAEDTARSIPKQEWSDLTAALQPKPVAPVVQPAKPSAGPSEPVPTRSATNSQSAASIPAPPAVPDPALVEAVVQRILDKMRPQVVEIITKEFLRPIVQALVHREIEKR